MMKFNEKSEFNEFVFYRKFRKCFPTKRTKCELYVDNLSARSVESLSMQ